MGENDLAEISMWLAKIFAVAVAIMVYYWGKYTDTTEGYMGGYNWYSDSLIFNFHPIFMTLGMVTLFTFSILSYRRSYFSHDVQKIIHACLNFLALGFIGAGLAAVIIFHNRELYPNLYSLHSMVGLTAVILFACNFILGFIFFALGLPMEERKKYHPFHVAIGVGAFIVAFAAVISGITEKNFFLGCGYTIDSVDNDPAKTYHKLQPGCQLSNGIGVMVAISTLLTLYGLYAYKKPNSSKAAQYADTAAADPSEQRPLV